MGIDRNAQGQEDASSRSTAIGIQKDMSPNKLQLPASPGSCGQGHRRRPKTASVTSLRHSDWNVHGHPPRGPVLASRGTEEHDTEEAEYSLDVGGSVSSLGGTKKEAESPSGGEFRVVACD